MSMVVIGIEFGFGFCLKIFVLCVSLKEEKTFEDIEWSRGLLIRDTPYPLFTVIMRLKPWSSYPDTINYNNYLKSGVQNP